MAAETLAQLRSTHSPAPGLLLHDWGEDTAVVYVPGTHSTHLVDAATAELLTRWTQALAEDETGPAATLLRERLQALLQSGILVSHKA